ncbi:hypothetical protein QUF90_10955 [Desulfococcaceae bacterium HSG9]|nr:hypothetical protein [Desulfococcaceae bacterium HSG9]
MIPPIFNHTWPDDVKALYNHDMQEIWNPKIAQHMRNQYHNQLELYFSFAGKNRKLKILDIGCAQGTLALLLAEKGHCVFSVPNGKYIRNSLPSFSNLGDTSQYRHFEFSADGDGHFFAFHDEELVQVFEKVGLKQIIVRFFETPWISGHLKFRYLHSFIPYTVLKLFDRILLRLPHTNQILAHQLLVSGKRS